MFCPKKKERSKEGEIGSEYGVFLRGVGQWVMERDYEGKYEESHPGPLGVYDIDGFLAS